MICLAPALPGPTGERHQVGRTPAEYWPDTALIFALILVPRLLCICIFTIGFLLEPPRFAIFETLEELEKLEEVL